MAALCTRISTGILQPFAKPFCAAHFPLAAAPLVVVAESLRCAALHSASAKLVLTNGGVSRKTRTQVMRGRCKSSGWYTELGG